MFDVVVVGAGLGGLTAAAKLSKEGAKVCVLEQHSRPGGCATSYRRKHFEVDASLHIMDGLDAYDPKDRILRDLGIRDELDFVPVPESVFHVVRGDKTFDMPTGLEAAIERLCTAYPRDRKQIGPVLRRMSQVRKELARFPYSPSRVMKQLPLFPFLFPNFMFAIRDSLGRFFDHRFRSEELKLALAAPLPLFHSDPYEMSAKFFSVGLAAFIEAGGVYVKGSSQQLSNRLKEAIERNGGEVRLGHRVTRLQVAGGQISGVEYKTRHGEGLVEARHVVANAAVPQVLSDLLEPGVDPGLQRRTASMKIGPSLIALHVGFDKPLAELGNRTYLSFDVPPSVERLLDMRTNLDAPYDQRIIGLTDYSQIDAGTAPEGTGLASMCALDDFDAWDGLGRTEYLEKKERVTEVLLQRLERLVPGARRHIVFQELGTPKTVQRYTLNTRGAFSGFVQSSRQALLRRFFRVRSSLPNLHFAGAWQFPGGGYTCAMLGGYLQSIMLLESRSFRKLPRLRQGTKQPILPAYSSAMRQALK